METRSAFIGPIETEVQVMLGIHREIIAETDVAERSPVGPRAVRVRLAADDRETAASRCRELADWLKQQGWVETAEVRPPNVYLRVCTEFLHSWVARGVTTWRPRRGEAVSPTVRLVRRSAESSLQSESLFMAREDRVVASLSALLAGCGSRVEVGADGNNDADDATATVIRVGRAAEPKDGNDFSAPVGHVDVRPCPLRARCGGAVNTADLLGELRARWHADRGLEAAGNGDAQELARRYADALVTFIVLRTPRARHLRLDDTRLHGEAANFNTVLAACALTEARAQGMSGDAGGGNRSEASAVRELAVELELLPRVAARAGNELEPVHVARYLQALAERIGASADAIDARDPLWPVARDALEASLALLGIEAEVWQLVPQDQKGNP